MEEEEEKMEAKMAAHRRLEAGSQEDLNVSKLMNGEAGGVDDDQSFMHERIHAFIHAHLRAQKEKRIAHEGTMFYDAQ